MGRRKSLKRQVQENLQSKLRIGESKKAAKARGDYREGIYSYSTYRAYLKQNIAFAEWCKAVHGCKYLSECKAFAPEYIQSRSNLSASTQKLDCAALQKLYNFDLELPKTPPRHRAEITRSRGPAQRDKHFNSDNNKDLVSFCRSTGLRRSELEHLHGDQLTEIDGKYYLEVKGKGGRVRYAPIIGNVALVVKRCKAAAESGRKVWGCVANAADIHSYRADYCKSIYDMYARDLEQIPIKERYYCKNDRSGCVFDKRAMKEASQALGHTRINVIAGHYLR